MRMDLPLLDDIERSEPGHLLMRHLHTPYGIRVNNSTSSQHTRSAAELGESCTSAQNASGSAKLR